MAGEPQHQSNTFQAHGCKAIIATVRKAPLSAVLTHKSYMSFSEMATALKDPTKVLGGPYEMRYEYDSPVYDFRHRQFVGFEHVRAIRTNTPEANSVATDTFFALANNCFESGCQQLDEPVLSSSGTAHLARPGSRRALLVRNPPQICDQALVYRFRRAPDTIRLRSTE